MKWKYFYDINIKSIRREAALNLLLPINKNKVQNYESSCAKIVHVIHNHRAISESRYKIMYSNNNAIMLLQVLNVSVESHRPTMSFLTPKKLTKAILL